MKEPRSKKPEATVEDEDALGDPRDAKGSPADPETLARERDEYLANWKRAAADYQNLRRRLQSDLDAAIARQKTGLLADLLLVLDYLDMALASPVETDEGRNLHAGVEATRSALLAVLEREGVRPMAEGGTFDPALHDCVARDDAEDAEPGRILEVLRRGYTLDGKVLRHAQVKVAGPAPADGEPEASEEP